MTLNIIESPHVTKYGFVYDRSTIEDLFANGVQSVREPATNSPGQMLDRSELDREPCLLLRNLLQKREAEWEALLQAEKQLEVENAMSPVVAAPAPEVSDTEQLRVKRRLFLKGVRRRG